MDRSLDLGNDFWLYLVGPIAGAALGALAYGFVRGEQPVASTPSSVSGGSNSHYAPTTAGQPSSSPGRLGRGG